METIGIAIGIVASYFLGHLVKWLLARASDVNLDCPEGVSEDQWKAIVESGNRAAGPGAGAGLIGTLERVLSFIAFYYAAPLIIAAWLAFKVGSKWQVWSHVVKVPPDLVEDKVSYLIARRAWGTWLLNRFWVGTLSNVLIGLGLAYVLRLVVCPSFSL